MEWPTWILEPKFLNKPGAEGVGTSGAALWTCPAAFFTSSTAWRALLVSLFWRAPTFLVASSTLVESWPKSSLPALALAELGPVAEPNPASVSLAAFSTLVAIGFWDLFRKLFTLAFASAMAPFPVVVGFLNLRGCYTEQFTHSWAMWNPGEVH